MSRRASQDKGKGEQPMRLKRCHLYYQSGGHQVDNHQLTTTPTSEPTTESAENFFGHRSQECLLWTRREYKDSVLQACIDHFVDACGVVPPPPSRDLCPDEEGHY
ncbi:uncharacterized protein LOC144100316 [Amblyomma americanum]